MTTDEIRSAGGCRQSVIPQGEVPCVWMTACVLSFRLCDRDLECADCPLDLALRNAPMPTPSADEIAGPPDPRVPQRVFLHPGHMWVRLRPGGEIFIIDFPKDSLAQRLWNEGYYPPEEVKVLLQRAGFEKVQVRLIEHEQVMWARGYRPRSARDDGRRGG